MGIEGKWTARARKFGCLFCTAWGFKKAAEHLNEVCGWSASARTLSRFCYQEGGKIEAWREQSSEAITPAEQFAAAEGEVEFQTDGTMVNTIEGGWSEVRVGLFLKRKAGPAARAALWDSRKLPTPTARSIRVYLGSSDDFAATWRDWAAILGIKDFSQITVIADGAKWIWGQADVQFPGSRGVLDIFHVLEHVATATRSVYGDNIGARQGWKDSAAMAILGDGWAGVCDWIGRWRTLELAERTPAINAATEELLGYLKAHTQHLGYCERLARGFPIGSGHIESANKYVIGRRLKRTGARWHDNHVRKMATVCSTQYVGDWTAYWESRLATVAI